MTADYVNDLAYQTGINFVFFVLWEVGDIVHVGFGVVGDDGSIAGGFW